MQYINGHDTDLQVDSVLLPFVRTEDEREARRHLTELIDRATPEIAKITKSSRTPEDAFQETVHQVLKQLRELRTGRKEDPIGNYAHYVKAIASRVVKGQVRAEHPRRRSLVDSVRHVLKRDPALALWDSDSQKLCGFASWRDQQIQRTSSDRLTRLLETPPIFHDVAPVKCDLATLSYAELLRLLFNWLNHPIRFDELIRIVCGLVRIEELRPRRIAGSGFWELGERIVDHAQLPDDYAQWRKFLGILWKEIEELPRTHRLAYLLNFTAADGHLDLFWIHGIASIRRIGAVLQLTNEEFLRAWEAVSSRAGIRQSWATRRAYDEKFALFWQSLPLPDAAIARMLGTERQKVINLRKAASRRLARRVLESISQ